MNTTLCNSIEEKMGLSTVVLLPINYDSIFTLLQKTEGAASLLWEVSACQPYIYVVLVSPDM